MCWIFVRVSLRQFSHSLQPIRIMICFPVANASRTLVPEASVRLIVVDDMKSLDELIPRDDNDYGVLTGSDGVEQIYKL